MRLDNVPEPIIQEPTGAVVRITTTAICGSDPPLYEALTPFMSESDVLGHEPMGIVEEVDSEVTSVMPGDQVIMPIQISHGHCFMRDQGLQTQCETKQVRDRSMRAALFGYSKRHGEVTGGQAALLRVPQADGTTIKVPEGPPEERFVYLFDVLPISWRAVAYAGMPEDGRVAVFELRLIWPTARIGSPRSALSRLRNIKRLLHLLCGRTSPEQEAQEQPNLQPIEHPVWYEAMTDKVSLGSDETVGPL